MIHLEPVTVLSDPEYQKIYDQIDLKDADEELVVALKAKDKDIYSIYDDSQLVGLTEFSIKKNAFLYIYISPVFRIKHIGKNVLIQCEERLLANNIENVMTKYKVDDYKSKIFANKYGYTRKFNSDYMKYVGGKFNIPNLPIKQYKDEYYDSAHEMYAKAFHEMRLSVGDFPDSVVEQPNENMRKNWGNTACERYVYIQDDIIIGYAHVEGNCIESISVRKEYQGQGIGRNFVKFICNKILDDGYKEVSLYCVVGNIKARKLYDSLNFKDIYSVEYASRRLDILQ